jgi:hypothetical protein
MYDIATAGQLTGVKDAQIIRRSDATPIGEVYKYGREWKAYAGYEIPTEFRGTWILKTQAIFAINEADRLYKGETYVGSI